MNKKKLLVFSFLSGVLLALSFPPYGFTLAIFIALVPLLYIENEVALSPLFKRKKTSVFGYSYLTFFIWNLICCYWIYFAKDFNTGDFVLVGVLFEVLANSLLYALLFLVYSICKKHLPKGLWPFAFVLFWLSLEYLHFQDWDLSWPWLVLGNVFSSLPFLVQWYEFTGTLGGSLWVLVLNWMFYEVWTEYKQQKKFNAFVFKQLLRADFYLLFPIVVSVIMYATYTEKENPVNVLCVQPNIDPYDEKFGGMTPLQQTKKMVNLALNKISDSTQYVLFPETAIQGVVWENQFKESEHLPALFPLFQKNAKINVVSGISSLAEVEVKDKEHLPISYRKMGNSYYESYNTAVQIDSGLNFQWYHKSLLVIGVERMPFASLLEPLQELIIDFGGTTGSLGTQKHRTVFTNEKTTIAPIICYESIYSDYLTEYVRNGAQLLFIMTNDGWWDDSPGYKQHFAYAKLRAIENRRSVARSANTGISAFINQRGDVISKTEWWKEDAIATTLNANEKLTFFSRFPWLIGMFSVVGFLLVLLYVIYKKVFSKKNLI